MFVLQVTVAQGIWTVKEENNERSWTSTQPANRVLGEGSREATEGFPNQTNQ